MMKLDVRWVRAALLACMTAAALSSGIVAESPAAAKTPPSTTAKTKTAPIRQFTGWVTAFDKGTLTVEKRGKQPRTIVFSKHAEMTTSGDVEKDARVTVYYRDDGGQLTAHRVVVKPASARAGARIRDASTGAT